MSFRQVLAETSQVKVLLGKVIVISSDVFCVYVCLYLYLQSGNALFAWRPVFLRQEKIKKRIEEQSLAGELVEIPEGYKGLVIGKEGSNLRRISNQTGAKVIRKSDREVYIVSGTEEQRQKAKVHIKITIVSNYNSHNRALRNATFI